MNHAIRMLVVGCGKMGGLHARAYHKMDDFDIVGLVSKDPEIGARLSAELGGLPLFDNYENALSVTAPDAVSINTYPDTHADFCMKALHAGCHVFVEKPLAETLEQAQAVVNLARETRRKVVVGYILRVHPLWQKFIEVAKTLGKPLVMRMNLNQQSSGQIWRNHKNLMNSFPPMVDCGVHYVDVMCQMTEAHPVSVHAVGARLTNDLKPGMYNYGHLHVAFDDGSVGWYEAGWGPMMSQEALFIKDVIGPKGSVSIAERHTQHQAAALAGGKTPVQTNVLRIHYADLDQEGQFVRQDNHIANIDEPDSQTLCCREQQLFLRAIRDDLDLSQHLQDAVNSLKILLAADLSCRTGQAVDLAHFRTRPEALSEPSEEHGLLCCVARR